MSYHWTESRREHGGGGITYTFTLTTTVYENTEIDNVCGYITKLPHSGEYFAFYYEGDAGSYLVKKTFSTLEEAKEFVIIGVVTEALS